MPNSFGLLKNLSVVFKVLACIVFVLMMIGVVGTVVSSKNQATPVPTPLILNMAFSGLLAFLMLFTFGEIIRILMTIEAQTRKS